MMQCVPPMLMLHSLADMDKERSIIVSGGHGGDAESRHERQETSVGQEGGSIHTEQERYDHLTDL